MRSLLLVVPLTVFCFLMGPLSPSAEAKTLEIFMKCLGQTPEKLVAKGDTSSHYFAVFSTGKNRLLVFSTERPPLRLKPMGYVLDITGAGGVKGDKLYAERRYAEVPYKLKKRLNTSGFLATSLMAYVIRPDYRGPITLTYTQQHPSGHLKLIWKNEFGWPHIPKVMPKSSKK